MKIIYVAGYSHSGSTLLDVILSASDEVVGLGEVSRAEKEKERRYFRIEELDDRYKEWWKFVLFGEMNDKLSKEVDRKKGILKLLQGKGGLFGRHFFARAATHFDVEYIVDSSKTTPLNFLRPKYLESEDVSITILHLIRDPISVLRSYCKRGVENIFLLAYISFEWAISNIVTYLLYKDKGYVLIDFESLMSDPASCLLSMSKQNDIPVTEAVRRLRNNIAFDQGGGFLGNGMRRQKKIYFDPPEGRITLPWYAKLIGHAVMPLYTLMSRGAS